jgi:hypothetical protein
VITGMRNKNTFEFESSYNDIVKSKGRFSKILKAAAEDESPLLKDLLFLITKIIKIKDEKPSSKIEQDTNNLLIEKLVDCIKEMIKVC